MAIKKQQRLSTQERKIQIKENILKIIFEEGMHKLSTRHLAQRIGISEGALFRHYPSKNAMIQGIIEDVSIELIENLKIISEKNIPAKERLEELICFTINYLHQKKGITLLLFTEASYKNENSLKSEMSHIYSSQKQYFTKIILDGITEGIWNANVNIENLATLYMGIPISMNIETILHIETFNHNIFCMQMKNFILRILTPDLTS
jgi:AcrR family transcriptional regulator